MKLAHFAALSSIVLCTAIWVWGAGTKGPEGELPLGTDGKPLNLDFETGTLKDWTATGDAFNNQPVKGDKVAARRTDMKSQHQGEYWIGGFEIAGDKPTGTLTSATFKVTHPWASFLFAAGTSDQTRAEIVSAADKAIILKTSGSEIENLGRVVVDLRKYQGKEIFIRLIDQDTRGWGHLNFDDFRFYTDEPKFPKEALAVAKAPPPPLDDVKNAGLSPEEAVKAITLPPGFSVSLFAGEPEVTQPVAFTIDARGRLWVAEAMTYPVRAKEGEGKDRIVIFEDTKGAGHADKRTVFMEGLNLVSGLEVGFGGVWVGAAPYFMFIPDKDGDDKPDGPPQILLDGFSYRDTHETLNAFIWGPDGWLYGCHGVFNPSNVGKPGTPDNQRTPINAGVWRYHPTKHIFEVFAEGTSNPWGVDFNDMGQAFCTACVIPHLYHMIQGGRYQRQAGNQFEKYTYKDIMTIADHVHWNNAAKDQWAANNRSDAMGGGHAHAGAMIYLGGAFPAEYRNSIFMSNIHGNRVNNDILEPQGSGYVGKHGKDLLLMNDKWSRLINLKYGPDGSVYMIDWYDKQACHLNKPEVWDRTNGRIYKVSYANRTAATPDLPRDLQKLSDAELVQLQAGNNDYFVRRARQILQERQSAEAKVSLNTMLNVASDPAKRLRALWALHCVGGDDEKVLLGQLKQANPYVRAWAIQLACEQSKASEDLIAEFTRLAAADPSPIVRLYLASALPRLPVEKRWDVLGGLLSHEEDATDHNLPCMYWYGLEPLVDLDKARALKLAATGKVPMVREFVTRKMTAGAK